MACILGLKYWCRITEPSSDLRRSSDYRSSYSTQDGKDRDLERNIGRELSRFRDGRTDSRDERRRSPESRRRDGPDPFGRDRDYCRERERGRDVGRSRDSDCGKDRNGRDRDRERHRSRDSDRYERDREERHKDRYNRNSDDEFDRERDFRRSRDRDYDKDRDRERGHERDRDWDYDNKDRAGYSKEWNRPRSDTDDHHHDEVVQIFLVFYCDCLICKFRLLLFGIQLYLQEKINYSSLMKEVHVDL